MVDWEWEHLHALQRAYDYAKEEWFEKQGFSPAKLCPDPQPQGDGISIFTWFHCRQTVALLFDFTRETVNLNQTARVYLIYILHCADGTLYTGIADNVIRRYWLHLTQKARCKYTHYRHPLRLMQCWSLLGSRGDAIRVERCIKKVNRQQKELLIASPQLLKFLAADKLGQELEIETFNPWFIDEITG